MRIHISILIVIVLSNACNSHDCSEEDYLESTARIISENNIISSLSYSTSFEDDRLVVERHLKIKIDYNASGHPVLWTNFTPNGEIEFYRKFTYDGNNRVVKVFEGNNIDSLTIRMSHTHDNLANTETIANYSNYGKLDNYILYHHNDSGIQISNKIFNLDSIQIEEVTYEYDENGNLVHSVKTNMTQNIIGEEKSFYHSCRLIRLEQYSLGEKILEREFKYNSNNMPTYEKHFELKDGYENAIHLEYNSLGLEESSTMTSQYLDDTIEYRNVVEIEYKS